MQSLNGSRMHTNLAFLRQVSTSEGKDEETCGCVAVAEASQFRGGCRVSVMAKFIKVLEFEQRHPLYTCNFQKNVCFMKSTKINLYASNY